MMVAYSIALLVGLLTCCHCGSPTTVSNQDENVIRFALAVSRHEVHDTKTGVNLALQHINQHSVLPGYRLEYGRPHHCECKRRKALDLFFRNITTDVNLGVVTSCCSNVTLTIASVISYWNIPQVGYSPVALINDDDLSSHNLFQVHSSPRGYIQAVTAIMEQYGWQRIAIISQDSELFIEIEKGLVDVLMNRSIDVIDPLTLTVSDIEARGEISFAQDVRIFLLNMDTATASIALHQACKRDMTFPKHVWITYAEGFNMLTEMASCRVHDTSSCCDRMKMKNFLNGVFVLETHYSHNNGYQVTANQDIIANTSLTGRSRLAYDSVWSLALALNSTMETIEQGSITETGCEELRGSLVPLHNFTYDNEMMGCVIMKSMQRQQFSGLSGLVSFHSDGTREVTSVRVLQWKQSKHHHHPDTKVIGYVNISTDFNPIFVYIEGANNQTTFGGPIPSDGTPLKHVSVMPLPLVVIYDILATIGILISIVCLAFNIIFRKKKIVKLTSPNLNYFIIVGAITLYSSVYIRLYLTPEEIYHQIRCNLQAILGCVGYVLVFAPVLVKMWRVYYIFHNPSPNKKAVKDWHLTVAVLVFVAFIVLMVTLSVAVPLFRPNLEYSTDKERPSGKSKDGLTINFCALECYASLGSFLWVALEYLYLILLQIAALILAFQTRKVKIKVLNDSKSIAAIIYVTSMVMVGLIIITFALDNFIVVAEALFSGGIMLATTVFVLFTFVPKMVSLYKDPKGEGIFSSKGGTTGNVDGDTLPTHVTAGQAGSEDEGYNKLLQKIQSLEEELLSYKNKEKTQNGIV